MRQLFLQIKDRYDGKPTQEDKPEVISIHIPKTAGLSFRQVLYGHYGKSHVLAKDQDALSSEKKTIQDYFKKRHKVIHGHLPYPLVKELNGCNTKVMVWLREPVSRVVSNYYYYRQHEFPKRLKKDPGSKLPTLEQYIEKPRSINAMSRYLDGITLDELYFIGFQEHYTEDLQRLATKAGWDLKEHDFRRRLNDNRQVKSRYPEPGEAIKARIVELNQLDVELYKKAIGTRPVQT